MPRLPVSGPEGPLRVTATTTPPAPHAGSEPPLRAVLFDFSGTLFQIRSYAERIRAVLPPPVDDTAMDHILNGLEAGLADPGVREAQRARDVSAEAHQHAFTTWYSSVPELAPVAEVLYGQLKTPEYWQPYADTASTVRQLADSGLALGVVSDIGWELRPTFAHHRLDHCFSSWVHSYEHGTEKPDPLLFHRACEELGVEPAAALMVGDHPANDGGAAGAGLRSYVLPAGAVPGSHRGLAAVLRLARLAS